MAIEFAPSARSTMGVEWELALIDRASGDLMPVAEHVLQAVCGQGQQEHPRIKQEMMTNMVEVITGVCRTAAEARADLTASVTELRQATDPLDLELISAGTHPFAQWAEQRVTPKPRYAELINRTQWWGRHMMIFGVHVHVGVDHRDKVLPILNSLLRYFPHLQALSASSPYWGGADTAYASNRAMMFRQLPTAGLPYQFRRWEELEHYTADMLTTGVIDEFNEIRWDLRPAPHLGTIEMRVCDGVPTLDEIISLAAFTQCLVDDLNERFSAGEDLPTIPDWFVTENKWRAARYGMEAIIITDDAGNERLVTEDLADELERLQPVAERLGCVDELAGVWDIVKAGASYQRQRAVAMRHGGNLRAVVDSLVAEMKADRPLPHFSRG